MNDLNHFLKPHICQSPEWGEFKTRMGTKAVSAGGVQFTVHKIPGLKLNIGYAPKVEENKIGWAELYRAGRDHGCVFIKIEPNSLQSSHRPSAIGYHLRPARPIFAPQTVFLNLDQSEDEILKKMQPKTRYNLRLAEKHGVIVEERNDEVALAEFIRLQKETAERQGFFIHPDNYYRTCFQALSPKGLAHLLIATQPTAVSRESPATLAAWFLFRYGETLYYPYGASDHRYRNLMASNLMMWSAIKLGRKMGLKIFDLWGATKDTADPWYGFTRFKLGFGGVLLDFAPAYDLVINPHLYPLLTAADSIRRALMKLKKGSV